MDDQYPVLIYEAWGQAMAERDRFHYVLMEMTWWLEKRLKVLDQAVDGLIEAQRVLASHLPRGS